MSDRQAIYDHIDANLDAHVAAIQSIVRQPSVSLEKLGMRECAAVLVESMKAAGCTEAEVVDVGDDYPGVWAAMDFGKPTTLFIYGHYDVRPVGTEAWTHAPFSGEAIPFGGFPKVVFGRGAAAQKGPLQAWLNAMSSIIATTGELPVNIAYLIEGAELLGSANYGKLVERYRDRLAKASALYGPKTAQDASGAISMTLGYKGLIYIELTASTAATGLGPQGGSVHSATAVVADNPVWRLLHAMATMTDASGREIRIPELAAVMAPLKPIEPWERPVLDAMRASAAGKDANGVIPGLLPNFPVRQFKEEMSTEDLLERYMYGASFNISGLRSGYTGPGSKSFLLPDSATATCDIRVISEVPADEIIAMVRRHLDGQGFTDIAIKVLAAYDWYQSSIESNLLQATLKTLDDYGCPRTIWPVQGFGGPWAHYAKVFDIPSLQGGGPLHGARMATSDEFLVVEGDGKVAGLATTERFYVDLLYRFAALQGE
ncbi:MAG TPA: M20/M25/M40 family metallo-hydrolase [Bosea sp. (in: a-proteobacteria)]|jgi:acetylornithine deacetylase/succinyl-diaminopimelate desuccinylase-like protein|uniref:M20/M25/M40 family metallo-hydrolase n=1 Tax=Bosea sp. (in: a-proteobacteria) TaxID=1871050 RepID=UPI002E0DD3B8|nr:M20/M25/M40 family metallo-hydrolase [Bosea sp. (in: a-proteobacteria)]